jgi:hypothetical protein
MNERDPSRMIVTLNIADLEGIVEAAVQRALSNGNGQPHEDNMLTIEEAARILGGDPDQQIAWLYFHSKKLPFAKRLSRKKLRFSETGLRRWLAARK